MRLHALGGDNWEIYNLARQMVADGQDVIELAIGEPDVPPPDYLVDATVEALKAGRTGYSPGAGEDTLRNALAMRYSKSSGRAIDAEQILCFPGTQTALYAVMRAIAGEADEVLVGDPMYATYGPVIAAAGARTVPIP